MYDGASMEPWCGGSNLITVAFPYLIGQCRPFKYGSSKSLMEEIRRGTTDKMGTNEEGHDCNFPLWMDMQDDSMIKLGLGVVFCIPDTDWNTEDTIFNNYKLKWDDYKD